MPQGRHGTKGGKKLRRCVPKNQTIRVLRGLPNKVKRGPLYKKNGPETRLPIYKPIPELLAFYERMVFVDVLKEKYR